MTSVNQPFVSDPCQCMSCRFPTYRHVTGAQHRPHTFGSDCWCIRADQFPLVCELDDPIWQNLPEVEYV